jgi:hypothetical protein
VPRLFLSLEIEGGNARTGVPGTAIMLMARTAISVKNASVHALGCGWTDPPYLGFPNETMMTIPGRTIQY